MNNNNRSCSQKVLRITKKYYLQILRSKGSPYNIAMGMALGLFWGMALLPLYGQSLVAIGCAWIFRANKVLAFAGTWISNPYTTPILCPLLCYIGAKIIGIQLTFAQIQSAVKDIITMFSFAKAFELGSNLIISFLVGSFLIGTITAIIGYFLTYKFIVHYRKIKAKRKLSKKNMKI
jgi:uncharacterized protein